MHDTPIYIFGYGRSGTNWLLNILALHHETHCRNEPDELSTSLFNRLPYSEGRFVPGDSFEKLWDDAVGWAAAHYGERDRMPRARKNYLYVWPFQIGMWRLLEKRTIRLLLNPISPGLAKSEWRLPWWLGPRDALKEARPVLKIVMKHNWFRWVAAHRPSSPIIHIVRHPGGVVQSWTRRYLNKHEHDDVLRANIDRLKKVIENEPEWGRIIGRLSTLSVKEAELWFWRYSTETMFATGMKNEKYMLVIYEELVSNPLGMTKKIYEFCSLSLNDERIEQITKPVSSSNQHGVQWYNKIQADSSIAGQWRKTISDSDKEIVERVLHGSTMEHWWK